MYSALSVKETIIKTKDICRSYGFDGLTCSIHEKKSTMKCYVYGLTYCDFNKLNIRKNAFRDN